MRAYSFFPPGYNLVQDNPDLILYHVHYYKSEDTLFLLYKNVKTGETVLDRIYNPSIPIFIAKNKPERNLDFIPARLTDRILVNYKNKANEVKEELFEYTPYKYRDKKTGRMIYGKKFPNIPRNAEMLHPSLFMYDVPIEQVAMSEFCINRYKEQDNMLYEDVNLPELNFASFDIETSKWPDGHWSINTNTFIDLQHKHAYIDFVRDTAKYNRQSEIINNKDKFIQAVKDVMEDAIANSKLKNDKERVKVQAICRDIMKDMKFFVRDFDSESDLILETTKTMFTTYKPDILMAYNATYDLGMFADRVRELELPNGTMNERGIGYDDILPPYDTDRNRDDTGTFVGDVVQPTKRRVFLNNVSHTMLADLQTCYFSARQGSVFANYKLDSLAEMVLGFGKFDYSFITNDILKLAEKDFWYHSIYALCDSILLLMINKVTDEFMSKLTFVYASKCNIEDTSQSSSTITRSFQTDAYVRQGMVPGCNISKVLKRMSVNEVKEVSNIIGVDFMPNYYSIIYRPGFEGGIASNPNKYDFDFSELSKYHNILSREAKLTMFKKILNTLYFDFKSHYPNQFITRNISKGSLYGRFEAVISKDTGTPIITRNYKYRGTSAYRDHLGSITLAIANDNIVSYANQTCNLPSLSEITDLLTEDKSKIKKPYIKPEPLPHFELPVPPKYHKLCSLLTKLNQLKFTSTDEESLNKDNKKFFFKNGSLSYLGTLVQFNYGEKDLLDTVEDDRGLREEPIAYGTYTKKNLVNDNEALNIPKNKPFEFGDIEYKELDNNILRELNETILFSKDFYIDGIRLILLNRVLYYPLEHKIKQINNTLKGKTPFVSNIQYRYIKLKETVKWEFKYYIEWLDIKLEITQQMQTVLLDD